MYCILYLLSGLIRIRRNSSLGPQELCQSKSCLGPSTQSQLELRGERRRRHISLPPASAARRSREEGRWKKKSAERAPLDLTAKLSSTKYTFEKPPKQARLLHWGWGCWTIFDCDGVWKAPWGGIERRPEPLLREEGSKELRRWRRWWRRRRRRRRREVNSQSFESFLWRSAVNKRRARGAAHSALVAPRRSAGGGVS